jgi:hypothetical protein
MSEQETNDLAPGIEPAWLDRLVDGELGEAERRALLVRLEAEPGGWRKCALAFLEAQCWRATAQGLARASGASHPNGRPALAARPPSLAFGLGLRSAAAASLLAAFALGIALARISGIVTAEHRGPRAQVARTTSLPTSLPPGPPAQRILEELDREVKAVAVLDLGGPAAPQLKVPILSGPGLDERWLNAQPSAVPAYLAQQWERQGYKVVTERKLYSVDLAGGGRLAIPIDEVKLRFVGHELN